jgi:formylglycine-generating enzyme required for sulfatase activity
MKIRIAAPVAVTLMAQVMSITLFAEDTPPLAIAPFDSAQAKQFQQAWAEQLGKPLVETNSIGMKMILIPPGEFMMGTAEADMRRELEQLKAEGSQWYKGSASGRSIETPMHRVRLTKPYYMGATEVTVGQFREFVEASGYKTEAERGLVYGNPSDSKNLRTWQKHLFKQTDEHPVLQLCQRDCKEFCKWLSDKEGREYVIPTEAQWEYACRAGTTTLWHFAGADDYEKLVDQYAWMSWDRRQPSGPKPVGERKPNAFGLYDVHGNVWEYVSDWYHEFYYKETPLNDPAGPETFNEMRDGRVMIRGGSFDWADYGARAAIRMRIRQDSNQHPHMGFRVARKIKDAPSVPPLADDTPAVREDSDPKTVKSIDAAKVQTAAVSDKFPKELTVQVADGVNIEFVLVPAGIFLMGDAGGLRDERPLHKVTITKPFYMGKFEVTQGQWMALFPKDDRLANWKRNPRTQPWVGPDKPMSFLDWNDCQKFIEALGEQAPGYRFSLPTEAQWEYACRAGSRSDFSFGDDAAQLSQYATFCALDAPPLREREPADLTVGHRKPNAWGVYDMHGGLWEWTADWYRGDYYGVSPAHDPQGPDTGLMRVLRGGSYFRYGKYARSAFRLGGHPDGSSSDYGMRVVMTLDDPAPAPSR